MLGRKAHQDSAAGFYAALISCWATFLCISAWFHSTRPWCAWTGCLVSMEFSPEWMHLFIQFTSFKMLNALASTSEEDCWSWMPLEEHMQGTDRATAGSFAYLCLGCGFQVTQAVAQPLSSQAKLAILLLDTGHTLEHHFIILSGQNTGMRERVHVYIYPCTCNYSGPGKQK